MYMFAVAATDVDFYNTNGLNYSSMVSTSARNEEKSSRRLVTMLFLIIFLNRIWISFAKLFGKFHPTPTM